MNRQQIDSGTEWEAKYGYSRAVRVGDRVFVAGTTATNADGVIVGISDAAAQAEQVLQNIKAALERIGASLEDVVRTRMYVVHRGDALTVAEVHGKFFGDIRPATTLLQVAGLLTPEMLVEIEAEAIVNVAQHMD